MRATLLSEERLHRIYRSRWADRLLRRRAADVVRKARLAERLPKAGLLLDVGGGTGHIAAAVLQDSPARRCVTADLWLPSLRMQNRLAARNSRVVAASATRLPFMDAAFDGAWLAFVLHHLLPEAQAAALTEASRVLRPGGTFVLIEDTPSSAREAATVLAADRLLNCETAAAPHHYRSPEGWRSALAAHGLAVVEEIAFSRVFPPMTLRRVPHRAFICRRAPSPRSPSG
jgi:SAM-dependent methyltransferase